SPMYIDKERLRVLQETRCDSKARGSVYDPVLGICCHFCRQKKLCGEEGCKRCGEGDFGQQCIGKTECSSCHSSNGILCRACLKVRYGEGKFNGTYYSWWIIFIRLLNLRRGGRDGRGQEEQEVDVPSLR
uniref:Zinc-finger domain-containing protein n=1 Tax=Aegilops tauschii subsp. strangulata TaxID=200361 RepID=A0A453H7E6_AEGTS